MVKRRELKYEFILVPHFKVMHIYFFIICIFQGWPCSTVIESHT